MIELKDYFPFIAGAIGAIVWLVRIEGRLNAVSKQSDNTDQEVKNLDVKLNEFDSKLLAKLSEIAERLSYIEGGIKGMARETRGKK